jgi:hypothetical protein
MRWERTSRPLSSVRLGSQRRAGEMFGAAQQRSKHNRPFEHDPRGDGPFAHPVEGATTSVVFEAYVEQVLAPTLRTGQVVVLDNLSAHKGERIRELIEGRGCELIYLPSYSPDLTIRSKKPSPRSRASLEKARPGLGRCSWRPSARRSRRSLPRMHMAFSSTADTMQRFNYFDRRCRRGVGRGGRHSPRLGQLRHDSSGDRTRVLLRLRSDDAAAVEVWARPRGSVAAGLRLGHVLYHSHGDRGQPHHSRSSRRDGGGSREFAVLGGLAFALAVAFVVAFSVNWYLISRGKGHVVVHQYHRGHHKRNEN